MLRSNVTFQLGEDGNMDLFYDPKNHADQERIETILTENGIAYELHPEPVTGKGPMQIFVSESDLERAADLIVQHDN